MVFNGIPLALFYKSTTRCIKTIKKIIIESFKNVYGIVYAVWFTLICFNIFIINKVISLFRVREKAKVFTGLTSFSCDTEFVLPPSGI